MGNKKKWLIPLLVIISVVLAIYIVKNYDLSAIYRLRAKTWIMLVMLFISYQSGGVYATGYILQQMKSKVSLITLYLILAASYSTNYTGPMKLGVPARIYLFKKVLDVPVSLGVSCLAVSYAIDLYVIFIIASLGVSFILPQYDLRVSLAGLAVAFGVGYLFFKISSAKIPPLKRFPRLSRFLTNFHIGIKRIKFRSFLLISSISFAKRLLFASGTYLILNNLGFKLNLATLLGVQCIATFVGFISMMPMGLGTKDVTLVFLLSQLGLSKDISVSLAIIERVLWSLLPFLIGIVSANILGVKLLGEKGERRVTGKAGTEEEVLSTTSKA